jgi:hypothetical protein
MIITSIYRRMMSLKANQHGGVLMMVGVGFVMLVVAAGAGYDLGRQQLVRMKIQQASDAAALAASGMPFGTNPPTRRNTAQMFFNLNYPANYLGVPRPPAPAINVAPNVSVTVSANANVPTSFVSNVGISTMLAQGRAVAQIKRDANSIDLILVMDNSGSMRATDVGAASFLDADQVSAMAACNVEYNNPTQVAYVNTFYPYPPPSNVTMLTWCNNPTIPTVWGYTGNFIHGLVGPTRINALRFAADSVANTLLNPNIHNHRVAVVKWDNSLVGFDGFSNSYAPVRASLMSMFAGVDTFSSVGLAQANALAAGFRPTAVHAIVLLTDGVNNNAFVENANTIALCNTLKAAPTNTVIYTIVFGTTAVNPTVRQFLSDCATGPNGVANPAPAPNEGTFFYAAPNAAALNAAFVNIVGSLQRVRILQ